LEGVGNLIGIGVQKARLYEETQRNLERIRALHEIDLAITSTLDLRTILDMLLEKTDLFLPYSAATIRLWNEKTRLLEPVACRNIDEEEWKADQWKGGRGSPNIAFETKATISIANCRTAPRHRRGRKRAWNGLHFYCEAARELLTPPPLADSLPFVNIFPQTDRRSP